MAFELPTLPYSKTALAAQGMCEETLDLHHGKHHQAYVTALNGFVEKDASLQGKSLEEIVKATASAGGPVFNNAGQHWNHIVFWQCMSPKGGSIPSALEKKINDDLGGVSKFKDEFKAAGISQFGSGWAWLVGCDVWEHSYYLDFRNRRPDYLQNWLDKIANYEFAEAQLKSA